VQRVRTRIALCAQPKRRQERLEEFCPANYRLALDGTNEAVGDKPDFSVRQTVNAVYGKPQIALRRIEYAALHPPRRVNISLVVDEPTEDCRRR
jgi:hypothetical protein